jgi:hypothetical protein
LVTKTHIDFVTTDLINLFIPTEHSAKIFEQSPGGIVVVASTSRTVDRRFESRKRRKKERKTFEKTFSNKARAKISIIRQEATLE